MPALATLNTAHLSDLIIATALHSGTYCCESWTYKILKTDVPQKENAHSRNYGPFKTKNKKHDPKLIKNIQIKDFSDTTLFLIIEYAITPVPQKQYISLSRAGFELWLYQTSRLDWCLTVIDHKPLDVYDERKNNHWIYAQYGISIRDLATYLVEQ